MDTVKADIDWLTGYATTLDRRSDEAARILTLLRDNQLDPDAFGDVGKELGTHAAYESAARSLTTQMERAEQVLDAAAKAVRDAAEHYAGTDDEAKRTLERKAGDDARA